MTAMADGRDRCPGRSLRFCPLLAICLVLSVARSACAPAETLEAGGLTFSDELGGFRLISASGSGRVSDPIVLVEEITGLGPAVLTIRPSEAAQNRSPGFGVLLRSLVKVVINRSGWRWSGFDLELRSELGQASVYSDGLSFDQIRVLSKPLHSDLFAAARTEDEPHDRLRFDQGRVQPGQAVRLAFNLVDINSRPVFFLAQEPIVLLAGTSIGMRTGLTISPNSQALLVTTTDLCVILSRSRQ